MSEERFEKKVEVDLMGFCDDPKTEEQLNTCIALQEVLHRIESVYHRAKVRLCAIDEDDVIHEVESDDFTFKCGGKPHDYLLRLDGNMHTSFYRLNGEVMDKTKRRYCEECDASKGVIVLYVPSWLGG